MIDVVRFEDLPSRFLDKIQFEPNTGCWLWVGSGTGKGYGSFWFNGRRYRAHRASYMLLIGQIPEGLQLDHKCFVRRCVNPDHLEPVTNQENTRRGGAAGHLGQANKKKTQCPKGHPLLGENLYIDPSYGFRTCRACRREAHIRHRGRNRPSQSSS